MYKEAICLVFPHLPLLSLLWQPLRTPPLVSRYVPFTLKFSLQGPDSLSLFNMSRHMPNFPVDSEYFWAPYVNEVVRYILHLLILKLSP